MCQNYNARLSFGRTARFDGLKRGIFVGQLVTNCPMEQCNEKTEKFFLILILIFCIKFLDSGENHYIAVENFYHFYGLSGILPALPEVL
jgi:hypothetical protein